MLSKAEAKSEALRQLTARGWVNKTQAAVLLDISLVTLWNWQRTGFIDSIMIGSRLAYLEEHITAALDARDSRDATKGK